MDYTLEPLTDFTIFTTQTRKPSQFDTSWLKTMDELQRELGYLRGKNVVLEVACSAADIRKDGLLRADARLTHPGVRLSFDSIHGRLSYTCDTYEARPYSQSWQHNVRAIVKSLESLRAVERHGATKGAQYAGSKALPSGGGIVLGGMTKDQAANILYEVSGCDTYTTPPEAAWRKARAIAHPDRHQGDQTTWDRVEAAANVLGYIR